MRSPSISSSFARLVAASTILSTKSTFVDAGLRKSNSASLTVAAAAVVSTASALTTDGNSGDDASPVHGLLRRGIVDEKLFNEALHRKLTEKAAAAAQSKGKRRLDADSRPDLNFIDCQTVACGEVFPALTRQELIDLVDSVVEPALGIANDPQCDTSNNDCCNVDGLLAICYGNVACQSGSQTGLFSCTPGTGVDPATGCCSNYAASGIRAEVREIIQYGVQARKICASCDEYVFPNDACYDDFCGADVYGHRATQSGLLLVPMDDNGMPVQGILHGSMWYHGTEASTCSIPSEQYKSFVGGAFSANVLSAILFAGFGTIGIAPDGQGYGASWDYFKGYLVKKSYEASAAVLWSKAREVLSKEYTGIELGCSAVVSGYSEGGYGAAAAPTGLKCIGVDVKRIQMGAAPFKLSSVQVLKGHENIQNEVFPSDQAFYLVLFGAAYSTYMPNALEPNSVTLLAENYTYNNEQYDIDGVLSLTTEGNSSSQMNNFIPQYDGIQNNGIDPLLIANPDVDSFLDNALAAGDNDPCSGSDLGVMAKFCSTIKDNDLSGFVEDLVGGTSSFNSTWAICHSPNEFINDPTTSDALVFVENIPDVIRDNSTYHVTLDEQYLGCTQGVDCLKDILGSPFANYIKTAPLSHQDAGARCVRAFANYLLTDEFSSLDSAAGSSTCQASIAGICSDDSINAGDSCAIDEQCACASASASAGDPFARRLGGDRSNRKLPGPVCGNDNKQGREECDGTDDTACPGACNADCSCPVGAVPTTSPTRAPSSSPTSCGICIFPSTPSPTPAPIACGARNSRCTQDGDCCSVNCKNNGRCG